MKKYLIIAIVSVLLFLSFQDSINSGISEIKYLLKNNPISIISDALNSVQP